MHALLPRRDPRRATEAAFTLIELLAVIMIVAVLAAIVIPVTSSVRAKGQATRCLSNLRQIGAAAHLYVNENKNRLPSSSHQRAPDGSSPKIPR